MQIKNLQFRPSLLGFVLTVIAVCVFGYLSIWQLGRADERKSLRQQVMEKTQLAPVVFDKKMVTLSEHRYRRFIMQGHFENHAQVILDNVVRHGKPGYEVITPFKLADSQDVVLVNRGWLQADMNRSVLPDITVTETSQQIIVSVDKPRSAPVVVNEIVESGGRWNYLDITFYRQQMNLDVPDYLLLLSPETGSGYDRQLPEIEDKSGMHIGYAIQWAAFAFIALGTFIGLSFRRREKT